MSRTFMFLNFPHAPVNPQTPTRETVVFLRPNISSDHKTSYSASELDLPAALCAQQLQTQTQLTGLMDCFSVTLPFFFLIPLTNYRDQKSDLNILA